MTSNFTPSNSGNPALLRFGRKKKLIEIRFLESENIIHYGHVLRFRPKFHWPPKNPSRAPWMHMII